MAIDIARLIVLDDFKMPQLGCKRTVRIYLPVDYSISSKHYPVIYMHDGQNVFQDETATYGTCWNVGKTLDEMQQAGDIEGCIVVATDCGEGGERYNEYSPWKMDASFDLPSRHDAQLHLFGGEGDKYIQFLCETLKPYIDEHYRTKSQREFTTIAGSSMGGYISLYGAFTRSDVFSAAGVFSPAFWFNHAEMFSFVESAQASNAIRIYMDMGTNETSDQERADFADVYLNGSREMKLLLEERQLPSALYYQEGVGHEHNEAAWALRFPDFARWTFGVPV